MEVFCVVASGGYNGCLCGCFRWLQWLFEVRKAALTQIQVVFILRHLEK